MSMRIAIVGGDAAGLYSALAIKKRHPKAEIVVFEKEAKAGRKLCATGNGHCNLLNKGITPNRYNRPELLSSYLKEYGYDALASELSSWGVKLLEKGDYVYPLSYSANSFVNFLTQLCKKNDIKIELNTTVFDYQEKADKIYINCSETKYDSVSFDRLIIATGGLSSPKLGSDGSIISVLIRHGYRIIDPKPGLAPVKCSFSGKMSYANGIRHNAVVRVFGKEGIFFEEEGEVFFKNDGLSGIVVFNAGSSIVRSSEKNPTIQLDLFPAVTKEELEAELTRGLLENSGFFLDGYFEQGLIDYILSYIHIQSEKAISKADINKLVAAIKEMKFTYLSQYPFDQSQVTCGGLDLSEVDVDLRSKKEPHVYFAGEVLDVDGDCGGFNLSWALMSSLIIANAIGR